MGISKIFLLQMQVICEASADSVGLCENVKRSQHSEVTEEGHAFQQILPGGGG